MTRICSQRVYRSIVFGWLVATISFSAVADEARPDPLAIPEVSRDKVICFALYTVHDQVLKLTAQFYPLKADEDRTARLEVQSTGEWKEIATTDIIERGFTAPFRVEGWDATEDVRYRVAHGKAAFYEGIIRRDPVEKNEIVMAAFTGNSIRPASGGDLPKQDLVENLRRLKPDLLFFSGDQVYDHHRHYAAWLRFGRDFGDIIRNTPTVTLPDDHDVGQANLWGARGKKSASQSGTDGGYFKPVEYVNEVQRAQTSHLPDSYDPTPVDRGITVYYTDLTVGGISFAILEDRKFKTGPEGIVPQTGPRPDHIRSDNYDPQDYDAPGAKLLGDRQLKFLRYWAADWQDCEMKTVLSQTIFCGGANIHGGVGRLNADLDANGWPQSGRNRALAEIRKAFAVHVAGDQHLGTVFHHGIEDWNDAGYSFCVPSIANYYLRWWRPQQPGGNRKDGAPDYTGEHVDGFGNKITCYAASNPSMAAPPPGGQLTTFAAGWGVVRFDKQQRTTTFDCWPRNVDITASDAKQYPGWPITVAQQANYGRKAVAWLPTLHIRGIDDPVVQVIDQQSGEIVYTLRIKGDTFRPKVFRKGTYAVKVGPSMKRDFQEIRNVDTIAEGDQVRLEIDFN